MQNGEENEKNFKIRYVRREVGDDIGRGCVSLETEKKRETWNFSRGYTIQYPKKGLNVGGGHKNAHKHNTLNSV